MCPDPHTGWVSSGFWMMMMMIEKMTPGAGPEQRESRSQQTGAGLGLTAHGPGPKGPVDPAAPGCPAPSCSHGQTTTATTGHGCGQGHEPPRHNAHPLAGWRPQERLVRWREHGTQRGLPRADTELPQAPCPGPQGPCPWC